MNELTADELWANKKEIIQAYLADPERLEEETDYSEILSPTIRTSLGAMWPRSR